jgi:hypothetical protein
VGEHERALDQPWDANILRSSPFWGVHPERSLRGHTNARAARTEAALALFPCFARHLLLAGEWGGERAHLGPQDVTQQIRL